MSTQFPHKRYFKEWQIPAFQWALQTAKEQPHIDVYERTLEILAFWTANPSHPTVPPFLGRMVEVGETLEEALDKPVVFTERPKSTPATKPYPVRQTYRPDRGLQPISVILDEMEPSNV